MILTNADLLLANHNSITPIDCCPGCTSDTVALELHSIPQETNQRNLFPSCRSIKMDKTIDKTIDIITKWETWISRGTRGAATRRKNGHDYILYAFDIILSNGPTAPHQHQRRSLHDYDDVWPSSADEEEEDERHGTAAREKKTNKVGGYKAGRQVTMILPAEKQKRQRRDLEIVWTCRGCGCQIKLIDDDTTPQRDLLPPTRTPAAAAPSSFPASLLRPVIQLMVLGLVQPHYK